MREDYIMRLIEQAAAMLAAIVAHRKTGDLPAAEEKIDVNCRQRIGLPLEMIRHASPEALTTFLERDGQLRYIDAVMLGELLIQDAELCDSTGKASDALRSREQAFCLLADSMPVMALDDSVSYRAKLDCLTAKLTEFTTDPYVLRKMSELKDALAAAEAGA